MAKIVDKEAKKEKILHAAMQVFAQRGIAGTKIHHIAKAAGVSQGTIYLYYTSKEEIFQRILALHTQSAEPMLTRSLSQDDGPREKIRKLIMGSIHPVAPEQVAFLLEVQAAMIRQSQRPDSPNTTPGIGKILKTILDEGVQTGLFRAVDTHALASAISGLVHGVQIMELIYMEDVPCQQIMETALEVLFRGIEKSPKNG